MKNKIIIFSTAYYPFVGGAEVAIKEIAQRIDDIEFDLITARLGKKLSKKERINNITVYRVGLGWPFLDKVLLPFLGYAKAKKLHTEKKYNIAWSMMASQASIAASFFKSKFIDIKLILTLQEGDEEEYLSRYVGGNKFLYKILIRPWHLLIFKKCDLITAISQYLKQRALKNISKEVKIIPNGVDLERFQENIPAQKLEELKKELGKKKGDIYLVHTGRSVLKNALCDVIKSLGYLPNHIKFLVIGIGPDHDKLKELVRDLKLEERVLFVGFVDHEEILKYLKISDIFIRPSLSEGFGNSFIEAMAAGLPVIATPAGGIVDFVFDPDLNQDKEPTGLFCEVRNPKSIAEKVEKMLDNNDLRNRIIENGKKLVAQKYSWDKIARDMREVFEKFL